MDELFEELEDVSRVQELDKVKDQAIALFGRSKLEQGRKKSKNKGKEKCTACKKPGHVEKDCWKKHPELLPQKFKEQNAKRKADEAESTESTTAKRPHVTVP